MKQGLAGLLTGIIITSILFLLGRSCDKHQPKQVDCEKICPIMDPPKEIIVKDKEEPKEIMELPPPDQLLPPPQFTEEMPEIFESKDPGEFKVSWEPVLGAKRYRIRMLDDQGKDFYNTSIKGNVIYVQRVKYQGGENPFTFYDLQLATINEEGEPGDFGPVRKVKFWKVHGYRKFTGSKDELLTAPEIKAIVIED